MKTFLRHVAVACTNLCIACYKWMLCKCIQNSTYTIWAKQGNNSVHYQYALYKICRHLSYLDPGTMPLVLCKEGRTSSPVTFILWHCQTIGTFFFFFCFSSGIRGAYVHSSSLENHVCTASSCDCVWMQN